METKVDRELRSIFEARLKVSDYSDELSMLNAEQWDSLAHIGVILEIEKRFQVKISTEEAIEMVSIRAIKEVLQQHGLT